MPLSSTRRPRYLYVALGLAVASHSQCGRGSADPSFKLRQAGSPQARGCVQTSDNQAIEASALRAGGSVRLTVVRRQSDGSRQLVCDALGKVPSDALNLDLGPGDRSSLEFYGEYFDESGQRQASGTLSFGAGAAATPTPTLHMYQTGAWSCPPSKLTQARGFHSATVLPTGEVLLLGGVTALSSYGPDVFGLLASAELYDPRSGTFSALTPQTGSLSARALHQAAVVSSSGSRTVVIAYGGLTGAAGQPALFVPDSPTQLRLMPGGVATPAGAELLVYDAQARSLSVSKLSVGSHQSGLLGGAALPGGGLLVAGGALFSSRLPFSRSSPAQLSPLAELGSFFPSGNDLDSGTTYTFANGSASSPWLLAPSVTPLSVNSALILGAKQPADATPAPQALLATSLPAGAAYPTAVAAMGPATVFHTATRLGPPISAMSGAGSAQVLVTGGFVQDPVPPNTTRQPPTMAAARLYTVANPAQPSGAPTYQAVTPAFPSGTCGMADGHYRPAGFEAATTTLSGQQVLITGGTPSVPATGCNECDADDPAANKLLCSLKQAALFDAGTQMLAPAPSLGLGRLGHQQVLLLDGNILVSGGLVRLRASGTEASDEVEVYNPQSKSTAGTDANDPLASLLKDRPRSGTSTVMACPRL